VVTTEESAEQSRGSGASSSSNAVSARSVSKTFAHGTTYVQALRDCTLEVESGSFVSVIGPSGCGKSTLLRMVSGLLEPDSGSVEVGGRSPKANRADKMFGFVPQTPSLMPWRTVLENVELLSKINRAAERRNPREKGNEIELLESVGLGQFLNSYPNELSGGMQQRVSLVRAFALGAPILLMDEPFAALDEITRNSMRYQLLELWERTRKTVLFVTHSIPEAVMLSDRVVVLAARPGRVTSDIAIDLPRPRSPEMEDSDEFVAHARLVRKALTEGFES
jgi:NitT/TauT family transport system ATP-binding protein